MRWASILFGLALLAGCTRPVATPRYELGRPYQAGSVWYYPRESYDLNETGLAAVYGTGHKPLTANGEIFDTSVAAAAHPTIQLPAVARLTNLENGRSLLVRINDRGTGNPGRLIEVTRRAAALLDMRGSDATRVRLEVLPAESHAAPDARAGNRPARRGDGHDASTAARHAGGGRWPWRDTSIGRAGRHPVRADEVAGNRHPGNS